MLNFIINADDYGFDENRTRAIQEAFGMGWLSSTTAMANMPWFERAMQEAKDLGLIGRVGLHFNMTEGPALCESTRQCPFFCDENGFFRTEFQHSIKNRLWLPDNIRRVVYEEAKAQISRYLECGGVMMHLDSHHHIHTDISIARILFPIAKEMGFASVRLSRNIGNGITIGKRIYKSIFNNYAAHWLKHRANFFGCVDDIITGRSYMHKDDVAEVMVHPLYGRWDELDMRGPLVDSITPLREQMMQLRDFGSIL